MKRIFQSRRKIICLGLAILIVQSCVTPPCEAYSVLTHEEVVDLVWKDNLVPLLKQCFPSATDDDLKQAHAFAYGGSLVQDMGYYPFGSKFFSDLTHYVRSGDFVVNLVNEASNLDEYAFALGALAHYAADNCGHPTVNRAVAIEFPKLRKKYGNEVTYEDNPKDHIRTEFGFDVTQVAKNHFTSDSYHDFIGFEISKPVLERAFQDTYGIPLASVIAKEDLAFGTFRRAISTVIPEMTRVALISRRKEIVADTPNFSERKFRYYLSRTSYQKEWGKGYRRPGFGTRLLAFFLKIVPKVGPFKALDFKIPNQQTEDLYVASVDRTVEEYKKLLQEAGTSNLQLTNTDFDTGHVTRAGEYALTDKTYAQLLNKLAANSFDQITPELKANILNFYSSPGEAFAKGLKPAELKKTQEELDKLRVAPNPGPTAKNTTSDVWSADPSKSENH
ncbi:MAG: zinc dependent phospholipase C family protein [Candidatus Sulfotelmatobacter sp.]